MVLGRARFDRPNKRVDQRFGRAVRILGHRRKRRARKAGGGNVVEPDYCCFGHASSGLLKRVHRADGGDVASGEDRVELRARRNQLAKRSSAVAFARRSIGS